MSVLKRALALCCILAASVATAQDAPTTPAAPAPASAAPAPAATPAPAPAATPAPAAPADAAPITGAAAVAEPVVTEPVAVTVAEPATEPATAIEPVPATEPAPDALSEAELLALAAPIEDEPYPRFRIYGFADFRFGQPTIEEGNSWAFFFNDNASFGIGNVNAYLDSQMHPMLRSMFEVRFLFLPNGAKTINPDGSITRTSTVVEDSTEVQRTLRYGAIEIERIYLEATPDPKFSLKAGTWLTPYGIWNVDHGSPALVGVYRPYIIGEGLIPERQTGIELYGALPLGNDDLSYHLTVSNGRGPADEAFDFDANKALGGRLAFTTYDLGELSVGVSGYAGRYTVLSEGITLDPVDGLLPVRTPAVQYDEVALAGDLRLRIDSFLLQGEVIVSERAYTDAGRPTPLGLATVIDPGAIGGALQPDDRRWGFYTIIGYRTPFLQTMPFVELDYYVLADPTLPRVWAGTVGLNSRAIESLTLKLQWGIAVFPGAASNGPGRDNYHGVDAQAAWAF